MLRNFKWPDLSRYNSTALFIACYLLLLLYSPVALDVVPSLKKFFEIKSKGIPTLFQFNPLLIALMLAPVMEELIFRLPLVQKKRYLLVSCLAGILFSLYYQSMALASSLTLFYLIISFFKGKITTKTHFVRIFISATFFSFIHLKNYALPCWWHYLLVAPVLLSPQFLLGTMCGIVRQKNIFLSMLLHSLYNGSILLIGILL